MNNFTFEWRDYMRINRITMKWIMQLIVWSTVVAYLPNTIWYFIGYPSDVIIAQVLVITVCVPLIVITSIRSYRKQCGYIPFDGCVQMEESCITIKKIAMKKAGYTHIEVRTVAGSDVKNIVLNKAGGNMTIKAAWRVETCRKRKGWLSTEQTRITKEPIGDMVSIKIPEEKMEELETFLKINYKNETIVKEVGRQ